MNSQSKASKSDLPRSLEMKKIFNSCLLHGCVKNNVSPFPLHLCKLRFVTVLVLITLWVMIMLDIWYLTKSVLNFYISRKGEIVLFNNTLNTFYLWYFLNIWLRTTQAKEKPGVVYEFRASKKLSSCRLWGSPFTNCTCSMNSRIIS